MSKHLSIDEIQLYTRRSLPQAELLYVDEHLRMCDECFEMLDDVPGVADVERSLFAPNDSDPFEDHLRYEQLEAYVDETIDEADREIVELHRDTCADCARQLAELAQIRSTLELEAAKPDLRLGRTRDVSFWAKVFAGNQLRFGVPALAAILIGAIALTVWLFKRPSTAINSSADPAVNGEILASNTGIGITNSEIAPISNSNSALPVPLVSIADGPGKIEIDSSGNLVGLNAPQFEARIKAALTSKSVEFPTTGRELRSKTGVLMSEGQPGVPFALTSPVGKVIESARPQFRWKALDQAESYVVSVYDANFNKVAESPPIQQTSWTSITLKRGIVYQWQVTAKKAGEEIRSPARPAPDARFKVTDSITANELEEAKRSFASSRLLLGVLYANAGLLDDAEREFQALLQKNPNSDVVRRLLNKVRSAK